jgi:hypothetical protein
MKTYKHENTRYYWDFYLKFWVVYKIDSDGNQIVDEPFTNEAEYYGNKAQLLAIYPNFKFIPE